MFGTAVTWKVFLPCLHRVANSSDLRSRVYTPSCHGHAAVTCSVSGPPEEYTMIRLLLGDGSRAVSVFSAMLVPCCTGS